MSLPVRVRELPGAEHASWDRFVAAAPSGSPYSTAEYLDVLCGATGGRFRIVAASRGDDIVAGVALYEVAGRFGAVVMPRLLLYYNGLVLAAHETRYPSVRASREVEGLAALEEWLRGAGYARLVLKSRSPVGDVRAFVERGWSAQPGYTYVVPLDDLGAQWSRVEQNLRRLVGRGEREGLTFAEDDDFDAFFRLHGGTHERKRAPVYLPRAAFEAYFRRLRRGQRHTTSFASSRSVPDGPARRWGLRRYNGSRRTPLKR